jgi:ABC-type phosphate transport system substrate-binding protein
MNVNQSSAPHCPKCAYEGNSATATRCTLCKHPFGTKFTPTDTSVSSDRRAFIGKGALASKSLPEDRVALATRPRQTKKSRFPLSWLVLALPTLLIGIGYLVGNNSPQTSSNTSNIPAPSSPSSGIQLYGSMKEVQNVPAGLFQYAGAVTFAALHAQTMRNAISQTYPDFRLRYKEPTQGKPGSTAGINMLLNAEVSFAQSARPLEDEEYRKAQAQNFVLEQIPVAIDGVAFYVHPSIPVSGLSIEQLQSIFLGNTTNWKQVGGPDLPIVPVSLDPKLVSMINLVLGDNKDKGLGPKVQIVRDVTAAVRKVAATPGAIGYASASEVSRQRTIHPLNLAKTGSKAYVEPVLGRNLVNVKAFQEGRYPLTRRLFVVIRRDGSLDELAGRAYANLLLSDEGQKIIEKAGFVALR